MILGYDTPIHLSELDGPAARATIDAVAATGATAVRVGCSPWLATDDHLTHLRAVLEHARRRGLAVMLTLAQLANNPDQDADTARAVSLEYIARVADAVGDLVAWWQVLNEWDGWDWRTRDGEPPAPGTPEGDTYLEETAAMIAAARALLHRESPGALVLTTVRGTTCDRATELRWRALYDGPVSRAVDAIGVNCYPGDWLEQYDELPARLDRIARRYAKPVVVCEFGLPSGDGRGEAERGFYLAAQAAAYAATSRVQAAFHYQWRDRTDVEGAEACFGVEGKDALHAMRAAARAV